MKAVFLFCLFGLFSALKASEEYRCSAWYDVWGLWAYQGWRIDEGSEHDCPPEAKGGQCVALLKCKCKMPYTGCWQANRKVSDYCKDPSSVEAIERGTPIATFDSLTANYKGHAAIFDSCDGENIKVMDQWCASSLKISTYTPAKTYYPMYYTIKKRSSDCLPYDKTNCKERPPHNAAEATPIEYKCPSYGLMPIYKGWKFDAGSSADCEDPKSEGGQSEALLTCTCDMPHTGCWQASRKVSDYCKDPLSARSADVIERGSPIAVFYNLASSYSGHAAIFDGCDGANIKVFEQRCNSGLQITTYPPGHQNYSEYYTIRKSNCASYDFTRCKKRSPELTDLCVVYEKLRPGLDWNNCYEHSWTTELFFLTGV